MERNKYSSYYPNLITKFLMWYHSYMRQNKYHVHDRFANNALEVLFEQIAVQYPISN